VNPHLARALVLLETSRPALAEQEARLAILEDQQNPFAYGVLANCLAEQEKFEEATAAAQDAVGADPNEWYGHYSLARILLLRHRPKDAVVPVLLAKELCPFSADVASLESTINFQLERWNDALAAADRGLSIDAEHVGCRNMRSMSLMRLGRYAEAQATAHGTLADAPEDEMTHATAGWNYLHQGNHKKALEHFAESLRLDPNFEYAQIGMLEAMKAKNPLFRTLVTFNLKMSQFTSNARWGILLGGYFAYRVALSQTRNNPTLAPYLMPLVALYMIFALWTWIGPPLADLSLRTNRLGRLALPPDRRRASTLFGLLAILSLAAVGIWKTTGEIGLRETSIFLAVLAVLAPCTFRCEPGWPRMLMGLYSLAFGAGAAVFLGAYILGRWAETHGQMDTARACVRVLLGIDDLFGTALLIGVFGCSFLMTVVPKR
jgi:tetratricopeptide (TPR) repeat protein